MTTGAWSRRRRLRTAVIAIRLARPPGMRPGMSVFTRVLRAGEGKKVKALASLVPDVNAFEPEVHALSDDALRARTGEFRTRLENGEDLDDLLLEAFAVVREAAQR